MQDGALAIVVGDVTGHGIGPALLMAETRAYLRILALYQNDIGDILTRANRVLSEDIDEERFVTLIIVKLNGNERTLRYASAGHAPCPWLDSQGKLKMELKRTGVPLGMRADVEYTASDTFSLEHGDLIALMTDGVEESLSVDQEMFGRERLLKMLRDNIGESSGNIVSQIHQAAENHTEGLPQQDDYTTIILRDNEKD